MRESPYYVFLYNSEYIYGTSLYLCFTASISSHLKRPGYSKKRRSLVTSLVECVRRIGENTPNL